MQIEFNRVYVSDAAEHPPVIKRRLLYPQDIISIGESIVKHSYTVLYTTMGELLVDGNYDYILKYINDETKRIEEEERSNRIINGDD